MLAAGQRLDPADKVDDEAAERGPDNGEEREDGDGRDDHSRLAQMERPLPPVIPSEETNESTRGRHHAEQEEQGVHVPGQRLNDLRVGGVGATQPGVAVGVWGTHGVHVSHMAQPRATHEHANTQKSRGRASPSVATSTHQCARKPDDMHAGRTTRT